MTGGSVRERPAVRTARAAPLLRATGTAPASHHPSPATRSTTTCEASCAHCTRTTASSTSLSACGTAPTGEGQRGCAGPPPAAPPCSRALALAAPALRRHCQHGGGQTRGLRPACCWEWGARGCGEVFGSRYQQCGAESYPCRNHTIQGSRKCPRAADLAGAL